MLRLYDYTQYLHSRTYHGTVHSNSSRLRSVMTLLQEQVLCDYTANVQTYKVPCTDCMLTWPESFLCFVARCSESHCWYRVRVVWIVCTTIHTIVVACRACITLACGLSAAFSPLIISRDSQPASQPASQPWKLHYRGELHAPTVPARRSSGWSPKSSCSLGWLVRTPYLPEEGGPSFPPRVCQGSCVSRVLRAWFTLCKALRAVFEIFTCRPPSQRAR